MNIELNFPDVICSLLHERFKQCLPLGLYKIWFRVRESSLEGLGDLLGYSDKDFAEMVSYSALSRTDGVVLLESWQNKLHIFVEVRRVYYGGEQVKTVRFGDRISLNNSPDAQINRSDESDWSNLTYKDREFMELFTLEYRDKYHSAHAVRNCSRLPPNIVRFLDSQKYNRLHPPSPDSSRDPDRESEIRHYLANSGEDVAPHLTAFNNNFSEFEKEEIFIEELRKRKEYHIVVASPNNRLSNWFRVPTGYNKTIDPLAEGNLTIGPTQMTNLKRKFSKQMILQILETVGGSVQRGHHLLLEQLMEINEDWTQDVLRSNGINCFHRLSPQETLALQTEANLTGKQRLVIARILKFFNGGVQVLAGEREISKVDWQVCTSQMHFDKLIYYVDKDGGEFLEFDETQELNRVRKQVDYFYCCPYEVLQDRLNYFRDIDNEPTNFKSIGMVLDNDQSKELPLYIFVTILGDHGGKEMKVVQLNSLRNGDGQRYSTCIGQFEAKESHFLFNNTIFPPINYGVEQLNRLMLLIVEWGGPDENIMPGFDYTFYPKELFLDTDDYYQLPSLLSWRTGPQGIEGVNYNVDSFRLFKHKDISIDDVRVRNVNIVCLSSGDTAYQMLLLCDRHNYSGCRCMLCNLKLNEWQDQSRTGVLYCNSDLERMQNELNVTVEELNELMMDEVEYEEVEELHGVMLQEAQADAHRGGVGAGRSLILPAIELKDCFAIMVLHIKLGLALALYNQFFLFIYENLEIENIEVRHWRIEVTSAKSAHQIKTNRVRELNDSSNEMSRRDKLRLLIEKNLKVKRDFDNRPDGRNPTVVQLRKYEEACHKLEEKEAEWNATGYFINDQDLSNAKDEYDEFLRLKEVAKLEEKESKKRLNDSIKELQGARKNQTSKPVKEATEKVMNKYGIITQAYHSHSLIGEHCHRLLMNRKDILVDIKGIWIDFTMDERMQDHFSFNIVDKIEEFLSQMSDLMEALDYCCSILARQNYWMNDNEISEFKSVALYFGIIWREYLHKSVPPKLHVLESHAHQFLSRWRNTGNFGEDTVERDHHDENKFNQLFCNKANWEERKRLIRDRKALYHNAEIASTANKIRESTTRKRVIDFSEEDERRQKKAAARVDLIKKVIIKTPSNSTNSQTSLRGDGEEADPSP